MKLLLDQNLPPRLAKDLADLFPASAHVSTLGLDQSDDDDLWTCARDHDYLLVSKDADFTDLSTLRGFPPKPIWIRLGNCTTAEIEELLRSHAEDIRQMTADADVGVLMLP